VSPDVFARWDITRKMRGKSTIKTTKLLLKIENDINKTGGVD
jgi:hypothetical protein